MGSLKRRRQTFATDRHRAKETEDKRRSKEMELIKSKRRRNKETRRLFTEVQPLAVKRINGLMAEAKSSGIQIIGVSQVAFKFRHLGEPGKPYLPGPSLVARTTYYAKLLGIDQAVFERTGKHVFLSRDLNYYGYVFDFVKGRLRLNKSKARLARVMQEIFEEEKEDFGRLLSETVETPKKP